MNRPAKKIGAMMSDYLVTLLVAFMAAAPGLIALYQGRSKMRADVAKTYEAMASEQAEQIDTLRKRIRELERGQIQLKAELASRELQMEQWQDGINLLIAQLERLGIEPAWRPK